MPKSKITIEPVSGGDPTNIMVDTLWEGQASYFGCYRTMIKAYKLSETEFYTFGENNDKYHVQINKGDSFHVLSISRV